MQNRFHAYLPMHRPVTADGILRINTVSGAIVMTLAVLSKRGMPRSQKRLGGLPRRLRRSFRSASVLKGSRVAFDIAGNKYRLVVALDYERQTCFVKFIEVSFRKWCRES